MSGTVKIGVVGCGNISTAYLENARMFAGFRITACADLNESATRRTADRFGLRPLGVPELLAHPSIDVVLNLTVPAAHFEISSGALGQGKHVFTEKPLTSALEDGRKLVSLAKDRDLSIGCAPDTFLGAAGRRARAIIDAGDIGTPILGTAVMMSSGPDVWHPDPAFYFQEGAGPVLDMAPYYLTMLVQLLGPVAEVGAMSRIGATERTIRGAGRKRGQTFPVQTPTSSAALLRFRDGAIVNMVMSFDVSRHSAAPIEIHGTRGSLSLPDPDTFGGPVRLARAGEGWSEIATDQDIFGRLNYPSPLDPDGPIDRANYRGVGLADFADAIGSGRSPRASGNLALHVLEVMQRIVAPIGTDRFNRIDSTVEPPEPLSEDEARSYVT